MNNIGKLVATQCWDSQITQNFVSNRDTINIALLKKKIIIAAI